MQASPFSFCFLLPFPFLARRIAAMSFFLLNRAPTFSTDVFVHEVTAVAAALRFFLFLIHIHFLLNRLIISCVYRPPGRKMTTRPSVGSSHRSELWYALSSIWSSSGWIRPLRRERRRRRFRVRQSLLTSRFHWALLPEANPCEAYFFRERVITFSAYPS